MEVKKLRFDDRVYESLYQDTKNELDIFKQVIQSSVVKEVNQLRVEVKQLTSERDILKGQVAQTEITIKEVKEQCSKRIAEAQKKHNDGRERQKGVYESREQDLQFEINLLNKKLISTENELVEIKNQLVEKDKKLVEQNTLLVSREEELNRLSIIEEKIDNLSELFITSFEEIKTKIKEEVKDVATQEILVEEVEKHEKKAQRSRDEIDNENKSILRDLQNGLTKTEVANKYFGHQKNPAVALSKRLATKNFKSLIGGEEYVE